MGKEKDVSVYLFEGIYQQYADNVKSYQVGFHVANATIIYLSKDGKYIARLHPNLKSITTKKAIVTKILELLKDGKILHIIVSKYTWDTNTAGASYGKSFFISIKPFKVDIVCCCPIEIKETKEATKTSLRRALNKIFNQVKEWS